MNDEDLECNPFYMALKTKHAKYYAEAQKACCLVCIPSASALGDNVAITAAITEAHVFTPSPYFQSEFVTFANSNSKSTHRTERVVDLRHNRITCKTGFDHFPDLRRERAGEGEETFHAKVLFEELFYNKKFQSFRVLCIDRVLNEPASNQRSDADRDSKFSTPRESVDEETELLRSEVGDAGMALVRDEVGAFMGGYRIVQGYLDDVEAKFTEISLQLMDEFQSIGVDLSHPKVETAIAEALECHLMDQFFSKLFPVIQTDTAQECATWRAAIVQAAGTTPAGLGIRAEFGCDLTRATVVLGTLTRMRTPIEMHWCLQSTLQQITTLVERHLKVNGIQQIAITTDDLIPLLSLTLINSRLAELPAYMAYMTRFAGGINDSSDFSFNTVTLRAAVDFAISHSKSMAPAATGATEAGAGIEWLESSALTPLEREGLQASVSKTTPTGSPRGTPHGSISRSPHGSPSAFSGRGSKPRTPRGSVPGLGGWGQMTQHEPAFRRKTVGIFAPASDAAKPAAGFFGSPRYGGVAFGQKGSVSNEGSTATTAAAAAAAAAAEPNPSTIALAENATATAEDMGDFLSGLALGY